MSIENYLELLTTNDLRDKLKLVGIRASALKKVDMVRLLNEYLCKKENILDIWNNLNLFEKDFLEAFIRANGKLDRSDKNEILEKYARKTSYYSYYTDSYFDENSKARLLFIRNEIPAPIFNRIKVFVKPLEFKLSVLTNEYVEDNSLSIICVSENFDKDFLSTAKLANNLKIKTTKENSYPTKSSVIKIDEMLENKEILLNGDIKDIRNFTQTTRIFGIISLMLASKIIKTHGDTIIPGKNFNPFLQIGMIDRAKMLLEAYLDTKDIDELARVKEIRAKPSNRNMNFKSTREKILAYISKSPINEWVNVEDMLKFLKKNDRDFLRNVTGEIETYNDYERYYSSGQHDWMEIEGRFVEISLIEYLSTMGIVDVAVIESGDEYGITEYFSAYYYRLTNLGAYLLHVIDEYEPPNQKANQQTSSEAGFTLQANFEIIVPDSGLKYKHCMFFDKFATKISDDIATVYKISFKSMVTALDNDISIHEIIEYIQTNCNNVVAENVMITLKEWELDSKKIRIRKVTIVETDDEFLMEELKSYKSIHSGITGDLTYAFEIESAEANKIKRSIEKKNHFCIIL